MIFKPGDEFLGRYLLQRLLGFGGFGSVWKATDTTLEDLPVAIKFLHEYENLPKDTRLRFRQEAQILAKLSHPGIPKVYTVGVSDDGQDYIVFEYVDGQTLLDHIRKGLILVDGLQYGVMLLEILEEIHGQGILHRDLKPENLLVTRDGGQLKLIDFGISKSENQALVRTKTGVILGTPLYMPPEILEGKKYTRQSDLYGAAQVVYELLAGRPAFSPDLDYSTLHALKKAGKIEPLSYLVENLPPMVDVTIQRTLSPNPSDRPESARELRDQIANLFEIVEGRASGVRPERTQEISVDRLKVHTKRSTGRVGKTTVPMVTTPVGVPGPESETRWTLPRIVGIVVGTVTLIGLLSMALIVRERPSTGPSSTSIVTVTTLTTKAGPSPYHPNDRHDQSEKAFVQLVRGLTGSTSKDLEAYIRVLNGSWKTQKYKTVLSDVFRTLGRTDEFSSLTKTLDDLVALPRVGRITYSLDLSSALFRLRELDEFAVSVGAAPCFEKSVQKLLGPYDDQPESPALVRRAVFTTHLASTIKVAHGGTWTWRLPFEPTSDAQLIIIVNNFDPKYVLEVEINGKYRTYFRNRNARSGDLRFEVPIYRDLDTGSFGSPVEYSNRGPYPEFVALAREIPRGVFRKGANELIFKPVTLPGPLRLPPGRRWATNFESGSLWQGYLAFAGELAGQ